MLEPTLMEEELGMLKEINAAGFEEKLAEKAGYEGAKVLTATNFPLSFQHVCLFLFHSVR